MPTAGRSTLRPLRKRGGYNRRTHPACGSGHILVEAYDLFKAIYQERGYRAKDIPALILQKNLFGLEIDDRAAQLAAFALMMKARADDRRIFDSEAKPNILAFEDSQGMNVTGITHALNSPINKDDVPSEYLFEEIQEEKDGLFSKKALAEKGHVSQGDIASLLELFENAKTFGSLIQVPPKLAAKLPEIENRLNDVLKHGDLTHAPAHVIKPLLQQARLLSRQYDSVVANPPYMASKFHTPRLKKHLETNFGGYEKDLFSAFVCRNLIFAKLHGRLGFMSPFVWMFLSRHTTLRVRVITQETISSLVQLEYSGFDGATVPICSFILQRGRVDGERGCYIRLADFRGAAQQGPKTLEAIRDRNCGWFFECSQSDLEKLPGSPVAYWVSRRFRNVFVAGRSLGELVHACAGLQTGDNGQFLRYWHEVDQERVGYGMSGREAAIASSKKWFPCNKGGGFRRWSGNRDYLVNWEGDGLEIHAFNDVPMDYAGSPVRAKEFYFQPSMSWSDITSGPPSFRAFPAGFIHEAKGMSAFATGALPLGVALAFCNTPIVTHAARALNPTLSFQVGNFETLPILQSEVEKATQAVIRKVERLVAVSTADWNAFERSWEFQSIPILTAFSEPTPTLETSYIAWITQNRDAVAEMNRLEEENNRIFIDAYGLADEVTPEVPIEQITLTVNPAYRYGGKLTEEELWTRFRQDTIEELLSYAIGCIMGRYSLDNSGLIYAHSGNQGFDTCQYKTFRADDDGIIPLLETDWGIRDDAANRLVEFISVAWPKEHLEENLKFIADSLGPNNGEQPRETIRRYLATGFYKHHLSMYKKRPIYWLFSSGKQRAFQCLVYLHRYHDGTLARMRTEYVIPLQGQIAARIEQLEGDKAKATSTSHRRKLQKEQDDLKKQQAELAAFEEKLKHAADQKISLDLDDGVKVNYAKFGDLLAEAKAITGGKDDE